MTPHTVTIARLEQLAAELDASLERIRRLLEDIDAARATPRQAAATANTITRNINLITQP